MSVQYFYNFCLKAVDHTDLSGDLLTAVRKSFMQQKVRIRDKITGNSDDQPLYYDFLIEKEKPMKWTVRNAAGKIEQEVMLSDNGMYYIYFYKEKILYKRLLFSKHHTLLKSEYFDAITGVAQHTLEPRKAQNSLCILYTVRNGAQPTALFDEPEIADEAIRSRMQKEFTDYTVIAATDKGLVRFLNDAQMAAFRSFKEKCESEAAAKREETFVDDTPLLDKIKASDFNVKRNLSSALDIKMAMAFGEHDEAEESPAEPIAMQAPVLAFAKELITDDADVDETILVDGSARFEETALDAVGSVETAPSVPVTDASASQQEASAPEESADTAVQPPEKAAEEPDKRIMADGAVYSYYGDLDEQGNRSGYGRTMTEEGRTAYEGHYFNDKRTGNGSYFYKNGLLCYTGEWMENVRHGIGVGVSSRDGSIHVGNWKNNKPDGNGVRLTAEGDIKFVCKELADGSTVLMHYLPDDSIVISKYDPHGMKLGDTAVSLKDLPIN